MKILHTADWHLGNVFYQYERSEEHAFFFEQLADIIRSEAPDVLLVTGDIFDSAVPSITVQRLYIRQLLHIHEARPAMQIVITSGNHDSPSRLELDNLLWESHGVRIVGTLDKSADGDIDWEKMVIHVEQGWIAAAPYVYPANYPGGDIDRTERIRRFYNTLLERIEARRQPHEPIIATAHMALIEKEDDGIIGKMEPISPSVFHPNYAYVALGHIHRPHHVDESRIRYAGSPIALSFHESYIHSVVLVEFEGTELRCTRKIPLRELYPVRDLSATPLTYDQIMAAVQNLDPQWRGYLRVKHLIEGSECPNLFYDIQRGLETKQARLCQVEGIRPQRDDSQNAPKFNDVEAFKQASPLEIAQMHYTDHYHVEMPQELIRCFEIATQKAESK